MRKHSREGFVAFAMMAIAAFVCWVSPADAGPREDPSFEKPSAAACRVAAAWPTIAFEQIDPQVAISACRLAISEDSRDFGSYVYLARTLIRDHRDQEAFNLLQPLRESGSSIIEAYLGVMYEMGNGTRQDYFEAMRWYRKAADQGLAAAQNNIGSLYSDGHGVPKDYAEALRWYRKAAERGLATAQNNIGNMFLNGQGVPQDYAEAMRWFRRATDQNYAYAEKNLGRMYSYGQGVTQDYAEAMRWYRKAADQGLPDAENAVGSAYESGQGVLQDPVEAMRWYRKAVDHGSTYAQANLGQLYDSGHGVPQDYAEAMRWYRKAADQGLAYGQNNVGRFYENGYGVPKDYVEAMKWYRKAADQGLAAAQLYIGDLYEKGHGVAQDDAEAVRWYRKAADQGDAGAQVNLGFMYGRGRGVVKDYSQAILWYRKAVDQGSPDGQANLGVLYENGQGVTQDYAQALSWYRIAADQGNALAQTALGLMYENGRGVAQDNAEAMRWYIRAAHQGDAYGQFHLGCMYLLAHGVQHDDAEAVRWYRRAADQGLSDAQTNLGEMYASGRGVPLDEAEAARWFRKAADQGDIYGQFRIGDMYRNGSGVPRDDTTAVDWYRKAADQGNSEAQASLGEMYLEGRAVVKDPAEAARWLTKAADQNSAIAQYHLASLYLNGRGVQQDYSEALRWLLKAAQNGEDRSREIISRAYGNTDDPLHASLLYNPDVRSALDDAAIKIGASFEESKLDCFAYLTDCGEIAWRRLDLAKAANWYRMKAAKDPIAAFRLGRLIDAHPELERTADEALASLRQAADAGNPEASFILATRNLAAVPSSDRLGVVEEALASFSSQTATSMAFGGATGRFGDAAIAPAYLYLKKRADLGITVAAVGLIDVYAFYGAYGEAEKVAATLRNADWFELTGWDYLIDHSLDFWLDEIAKGNAPKEGSLDGLRRLLSTLSTKGSRPAARLLSKLDGLTQVITAYASRPASEKGTLSLTATEWKNILDRIQSRIAEKQKLGGLSALMVELYQARSLAEAALGQREEATKSVLLGLSAAEQINAATRYQKGSLVYHLEQSCQLRKASESLNGLDQSELSLLLAKAAVNELQDARTELIGLPAGLQGCFRDQISDQYRVLAELLIQQGHFLEAEWALGQLKDFESYEFNREERSYAGGALGHTPMTDEQNSVLAQITSLPLQDLAQLTRQSNDLNLDPDPSDEVRVNRTQVEDLLIKAKRDLDNQLAGLKESIAALHPSRDADTFNTREGIDDLVTAELPANTAIFYTVVLPERIHVLITTGGETEHLVIPISEKQLNELIGEARVNLQDNAKDPIPALQALYDLLWKAADPDLRKLGVTDVVLSLDRQLRYLPFQALHDGQSYLAERYRFTLLTAKQNAQILAPGGLPKLTVQAFGTSLGQSPYFDPLPDVPEEIDGIVKDPGSDNLGVLPGKRWLDGAFSRNRLAAALAGNPPIIHIATHFAVGATDDTSRMLLGDGPMTLADLKDNIDSHRFAFVNVSLLVLSACETAFGNGSELESLAAVMRDKGVKSVVATLWPVSDPSTAVFMVRFYSYLSLGLPRGQALQRAQIDFIRNQQDRPLDGHGDIPKADANSGATWTNIPTTTDHSFAPFSHPRYWAPFILMGQWK